MQNNLLYLSIMFLMFTGCHTHNHDHSQEGHSHDTPLFLSGYSDLYEVFIEADPFAQGKQSPVVLYLTELPNKPAEVTSVTVSLIIGEKGIRQTQDHSVSPGVYQFSLMPETAGDAKIVVDITSVYGKSQVEIETIKVYEDAHTAEYLAEEQSENNPDAISFNKQQQWRIDFALDKPLIQPFGQVIRTTGQITSSQEDESFIIARASGIVLFNRNLIEGQKVSLGQELFSISGSGMAENNLNVRFVEARNNYIKAEGDYQRAQELVEDKIVSTKEFLEIKSNYETSKAVYDNLYKNFSTDGQRVSSSLNGFLKQLLVSNGEYVEAGQALASVSKNRTLLLKADVQMKYASLLSAVSDANFRILNTDKAYSLSELNGKVLSYGKTVNEGNFMLPVSFQIDNQLDFIPGSFVEVFIKTQTNRTALTIPNAALTEEQGNYFVYVQLTPETFEKREVSVGVTDGINSEVLSGLTSSDRIINRGAISVKLAQSAGALDPHAGHVH